MEALLWQHHLVSLLASTQRISPKDQQINSGAPQDLPLLSLALTYMVFFKRQGIYGAHTGVGEVTRSTVCRVGVPSRPNRNLIYRRKRESPD